MHKCPLYSSALHILQALERQELALKSNLMVKREELEAEINELEAKISSDCDNGSLCEDLDNSLGVSMENLHIAKKVRTGFYLSS